MVDCILDLIFVWSYLYITELLKADCLVLKSNKLLDLEKAGTDFHSIHGYKNLSIPCMALLCSSVNCIEQKLGSSI